MIRVYPVSRPYVWRRSDSLASFPASSEEVERLLAAYPLVSASRSRVKLAASNGATVEIYPATLGGGPAFEIVR